MYICERPIQPTRSSVRPVVKPRLGLLKFPGEAIKFIEKTTSNPKVAKTKPGSTSIFL